EGRIRQNAYGRHLPLQPCVSRSRADGRTWIVEQSCVRVDEIAVTFVSRQRREEALPLFREEGRDTAPVEPVELPAACGEHAGQNQLADAPRMPFGVRECEAAAPRAAENEPPIDAHVLAEAF